MLLCLADSIDSSVSPGLMRQPTLDLSVTHNEKQQELSQAISPPAVKNVLKQKSLDEYKPQGHVGPDTGDSKRKSWGCDSKNQDLAPKQSGAEEQTNKQHQFDELKQDVTTPSKQKLSRKPSGKKKAQAIEKQPSDTECQLESTLASPHAKEAAIKIPGKKLLDHSEQQSHSMPSVTDLPHFIESLEATHDGRFIINISRNCSYWFVCF